MLLLLLQPHPMFAALLYARLWPVLPSTMGKPVQEGTQRICTCAYFGNNILHQKKQAITMSTLPSQGSWC